MPSPVMTAGPGTGRNRSETMRTMPMSQAQSPYQPNRSTPSGPLKRSSIASPTKIIETSMMGMRPQRTADGRQRIARPPSGVHVNSGTPCGGVKVRKMDAARTARWVLPVVPAAAVVEHASRVLQGKEHARRVLYGKASGRGAIAPRPRCYQMTTASPAGRALAVHPRPGQFEVFLLFLVRLQHAPLVAAFPADDVVRPAALLRPPLPGGRPRGVGVHRLARFLVPEQGLALAVAKHAHVDRGERRGAQGRGAERVLVLPPEAVEEVLPEGVGVVPLEPARHPGSLLGHFARRAARGRVDLLRDDRVAEFAALLRVLRVDWLRVEQEGSRVPADALLDAVVVAHGRGHEDLAPLVVVGDDGGHVRDVAGVVLHVDAAAANDAARVADAHGRDQVRRLMDEQVGEHAAAEWPVAAPLGVHRSVERHVLRRRPEGFAADVELVAQPQIPVDRGRVHVPGQRVVAPLADVRVAEVAGLAHEHLADVPGPDVLVGQPPCRVGHRLHADGHHLAGLLPGIDDGVGLGDRPGHRLFAVHGLAGHQGVDRLPGVPVVGSGDADDVHVLLFEDDAVVLGDVLLVALGDAAALRGRVEALALVGLGVPVEPFHRVAVPDVAGRDGNDALLLVAHLEDDIDVLLAPAADADERDAEVVVGPEDAVVARGGERHRRPGGDAGLHEITTINLFGHGEDSGIGCHCFACFNIHSYSSSVAYALSHELWPTFGYSEYFGFPPAFFRASIMSRLRATGTAVSASPWKHQHGMSLILSASLGFPPPQIGTIAAHLSGMAAARLQVPYPPIDSPVRYRRLASTLYSFCTASRMPSAILADVPPACQPRTGACGMMVRHWNVFSRALMGVPMATSIGIFFPPLVSPAPCRNRIVGVGLSFLYSCGTNRTYLCSVPESSFNVLSRKPESAADAVAATATSPARDSRRIMAVSTGGWVWRKPTRTDVGPPHGYSNFRATGSALAIYNWHPGPATIPRHERTPSPRADRKVPDPGRGRPVDGHRGRGLLSDPRARAHSQAAVPGHIARVRTPADSPGGEEAGAGTAVARGVGDLVGHRDRVDRDRDSSQRPHARGGAAKLERQGTGAEAGIPGVRGGPVPKNFRRDQRAGLLGRRLFDARAYQSIGQRGDRHPDHGGRRRAVPVVSTVRGRAVSGPGPAGVLGGSGGAHPRHDHGHQSGDRPLPDGQSESQHHPGRPGLCHPGRVRNAVRPDLGNPHILLQLHPVPRVRRRLLSAGSLCPRRVRLRLGVPYDRHPAAGDPPDDSLGGRTRGNWQGGGLEPAHHPAGARLLGILLGADGYAPGRADHGDAQNHRRAHGRAEAGGKVGVGRIVGLLAEHDLNPVRVGRDGHLGRRFSLLRPLNCPREPESDVLLARQLQRFTVHVQRDFPIAVIEEPDLYLRPRPGPLPVRRDIELLHSLVVRLTRVLLGRVRLGGFFLRGWLVRIKRLTRERDLDLRDLRCVLVLPVALLRPVPLLRFGRRRCLFLLHPGSRLGDEWRRGGREWLWGGRAPDRGGQRIGRDVSGRRLRDRRPPPAIGGRCVG